METLEVPHTHKAACGVHSAHFQVAALAHTETVSQYEEGSMWADIR
jgi:hypothetical protein